IFPIGWRAITAFWTIGAIRASPPPGAPSMPSTCPVASSCGRYPWGSIPNSRPGAFPRQGPRIMVARWSAKGAWCSSRPPRTPRSGPLTKKQGRRSGRPNFPLRAMRPRRSTASGASNIWSSPVGAARSAAFQGTVMWPLPWRGTDPPPGTSLQALSTFGGAAILTGQAAFLVDDIGRTTAFTAMARDLRAVQDIAFQGPCHPVFPGIDLFAVQLKAVDQVHDLIDGHAMAQGAGDQFGIVPIFRVEFMGEALYGRLIAL